MREYIRKSSGLDRSLTRRLKAVIGDYDRLKKRRLDIIYGGSTRQDGMPHGGGVGKPTEEKGTRLAEIDRELEAIDQTCVEIRAIYSAKVQPEFDPIKAYWQYDYFNYMHIRSPISPEGPSRRTWNRYKDRIHMMLAKKLGLF
ncbi:hypothetical protein [Ligaoa zhengdingensis]|jgi:hypothetical protein|uniref:hypothetical protein n=1 Tax=Ligaoa zhengdingensis TaxID=2763658 RepID=UPI00204856DA|nr:MAG TPA: hypothetical protein [Caudoviricetes sp.]